MSFPSLTERPLLALGGLERLPLAGERARLKAGNSLQALGAPAIEDEDPSALRSLEDGPFRTIVTADLVQLAELGERDVDEPPASTAAEFLNAFASLLASVSSGDSVAARDAANLLQLELFRAPDDAAAGAGEAPLRMLEDLVALIRFARLGDLGAAEGAAELMARHMQSALVAPQSPEAPAERLGRRRRAARLANRREPPTLVQGATAAYELVMNADANAA